jgi:hypothetical protein
MIANQTATGAPKLFSKFKPRWFSERLLRSPRYDDLHFGSKGANMPLVRQGGGQGVIRKQLSLGARGASRHPGVEVLRGTRRER